MQNIQRISRVAAAAAVSILTCAVATACAKKDQARNTNAAQNTASTPAVDSTQIASQGATSTATPPTGGDSAGLQGNTTPVTGSQGGTVPPRTTRRSNAARNGAVAGTAVAARSTRNRSSGNVRVDENSSATMRSNREAGVTTRNGDSSAITATAAATDANWLAEPQIYNIVFLANRGDSVLSARAICLNPNAPVSASTPVTGASDAQVRSFAQQMVRDHAQLNQKANQLARAQNVAATRSDASDQVFSATQDAMNSSENGHDYINREVTAHQNLLNTLDTKLIPSARDTSLRRMLIDARAVVQSHLEQARRLQSGQPVTSTSMNMSTSRDTLSASASLNAQPRPDTIRATASASMSQPTTPSASTSITATTPSPSVTATTSTTATPTAMAPTATTTTSINATAPAPTATVAVSTTNPCEPSRPAAVAPSSTSPAVTPSSTSPSLSPSYAAPVKPDTVRVRASDSLRVRIDTGTTRQPAPVPAKP